MMNEAVAEPCSRPSAMAPSYPLGMNIYGPFEAGFSSSQGPTVCSNSSYYCAGGADIETCTEELEWTCGTGGASSLATTLASSVFGDACGGHASPYHFRARP